MHCLCQIAKQATCKAQYTLPYQLTIFKRLYSDISTKGACTQHCPGGNYEGIAAEGSERVDREVASGGDDLHDLSRVQGSVIDDVISDEPVLVLDEGRVPRQ